MDHNEMPFLACTDRQEHWLSDVSQDLVVASQRGVELLLGDFDEGLEGEIFRRQHTHVEVLGRENVGGQECSVVAHVIDADVAVSEACVAIIGSAGWQRICGCSCGRAYGGMGVDMGA